jgi:urease accessory protein
VTAVHADGLLELAFECDARGRSALCERRQRFPLRTTVPLYIDPADRGMAFVYAQNPTGGVFAGDRLRTALRVRDGARVHLTTQSATKLYRSDAGEALQELSLEVGPGAYVEHVPDPLIPHAGARFTQRLVADVAPGGAFVAAETVTPGRRAYGERMAYERLVLHTEVRSEGRELCVDRIELEPGRADPRAAGVLAAGDYLVTLLAIAPGGDGAELADALDAALAAEETAGGGARGVFIGAAGELPGGAGALARAVASDSLAARRALTLMWRVAREALAGLPLPPVRK